jgi:hypothetical protein
MVGGTEFYSISSRLNVKYNLWIFVKWFGNDQLLFHLGFTFIPKKTHNHHKHHVYHMYIERVGNENIYFGATMWTPNIIDVKYK